MSSHLLSSSRVVVFLGLLGLAGCDVNLAVEDPDPAELGIWREKLLRQWLLNLKDEGRRGVASQTLATFGPDDKDMVPTLIALLKDDDRIVRAGACRLLGQIGPKAKDAMKPLDDLLVDPDKLVRIECLYARKRIRNLVA
jgi:HEAT repeat protein